MDKVALLSEQMMLHYSSPNNHLVVEVLQLDASAFSAVSEEQLSKYIIVLGQYMVMLQYNINLKAVEYLLASKTFEHKVMVKTLKETFPSNIKTDKAKRAMVIDSTPELQEMMNEVLVAESQKVILSDMNKAVESLLNALKKEKSTRTTYTSEY
jgi:glyceraldehyde-3-phosphate dehydrogenase/erythrose-4-phosphate dehydrogenase